MKRMIKASAGKKYQCYYNETINVEQSDGSTRSYIGKKVLTDSFDTEAEAERYCRTHVGAQKVGDDYIENDMNYEEVDASTRTIRANSDEMADSDIDYRVYQLDEDGEEDFCLKSFNDKNQAIRYAMDCILPTHVVAVDWDADYTEVIWPEE